MHRWGTLTNGKILNIGAENYPFPFPLEKNASGQWYFNSDSVLNAMADAQADYFAQTHDGSNVHQYAQKIASDEGKQNGLYRKSSDDQEKVRLGRSQLVRAPKTMVATTNRHRSRSTDIFIGSSQSKAATRVAARKTMSSAET
jgi:hypothetical protein